MFDILKLQDLRLENAQLRQDYYNYFISGDIASALQILSDNPSLASQVMNAENLNQYVSAILELENLYDTNATKFLASGVSTYQLNIDNLIYIQNFSATVQYTVNNFVLYNNDIYYCYNTPTIGTLPTNTAYWKFLGLSGEDGVPSLNVNYQGAWNSAQTYTQKDMVVYQNNLYVAIGTSINKNPVTSPQDWYLAVTMIKAKIYVSKEEPPNLGVGDIWVRIIIGKELFYAGEIYAGQNIGVI